MRQAILTKYIGPTNHRGARVKATCEVKSRTYPWKYELGIDGNHIEAAKRLAKELGWDGFWAGGATEHGCCFVWEDEDVFHIAKVWRTNAENLEEELA